MTFGALRLARNAIGLAIKQLGDFNRELAAHHHVFSDITVQLMQGFFLLLARQLDLALQIAPLSQLPLDDGRFF